MGLDEKGRVNRLNLFDMGIEVIPSDIGLLDRMEGLALGNNRLCAIDSTGPEPIPEAMKRWLDGMDRDWRTTQRCP